MKNHLNKLKDLGILPLTLSSIFQYHARRTGKNYFSTLWIDDDFLLKKESTNTLELRNFADTNFQNFRINYLECTRIYLAVTYLLRNVNSRLSVRNIADTAYLDFQANDIYCAELLTNIVRADVFYKLASGLASPFGDGDTTPTVVAVGLAYTANTNPTVITNFDNGNPGQELTIIFQDNLTTVNHGGNIFLSGGGNKGFTVGQTLKLIFASCDGGGSYHWYQNGGEI